jgi:hypothetical protein
MDQARAFNVEFSKEIHMVSRVLNIAVRTAHLAAMGILLGGHAFDIERERLHVALWLTIGTGIALSAIEAGPRLLWFHQGRGLLTMAKVVLMCAVPFVWDYRLLILLIVVVIASVGSHMPARYRYYSVIHREVIPDGAGPGTGQFRRDREREGEP